VTAGTAPGASPRQGARPAEVALLASVFVVAACGLVYELAAAALASVLLGDSVLQFSTVIGAFLFAMGIGSWLSRFLDRQLVAHFVRIELLVGLIGGLLPAALFALHSWAPPSFRVALYGGVLAVGILAGLEIPLVMRILKRHFAERYALKDLVGNVLTFDYLGALAVSVAFPLLFVPHLGIVRTGAFFGLMNALVAVWAMWVFRHELRRPLAHAAAAAGVIAALAAALAGADRLSTWAEDRFYEDPVVRAHTSPYQRIVVTQGPSGLRLFLNGNLQFHSRDEYRYHEALVHPAMAIHGAPRRVAVLGGGDGLAVREILRHPSVESVTLVELDPAMTELFSREPVLAALHGGVFDSPKLRVVHEDAFSWLERQVAGGEAPYDVIVVDFPDPTNHRIGKLYTLTFYRLLDQALAAGGVAAVQTTSPLIARQSYWTVVTTIEAAGLNTAPYHALVPSFGEWGFVLASRRPLPAPASAAWPARPPAGLRFLSADGLPALFHFPPDMARVPAEVNRLGTQPLVTIYEREWGRVTE
jgi:spermidine synthase